MSLSSSYCSIKDLFSGYDQYLIPLYQRTYCWQQTQWLALWEDVKHLNESTSPYHFFGSVVVMKIDNKPGGANQYLLIDGQQRLSTIQILLKSIGNQLKLSEITDQYLKNIHSKDLSERLKIYPTKADQQVFEGIISGNITDQMRHPMNLAYEFFKNKIENISLHDLEKIKNDILEKIKVVHIKLGQDDNPYEIFESLNAKGAPLTQADLIRNFLFMQFADNEKQQDDIYMCFWLPLQDRLTKDHGDHISKFIKHFLSMNGIQSHEKNVYQSFANHYKKLGKDEFIALLEQLNFYSALYAKLLNAELEMDIELKKVLHRINRIELGTSYPLLMYLFEKYQSKHLDKKVLVDILNFLIYYVIRKFICGHPSNPYNKIFISILAELNESIDTQHLTLDSFKELLFKRKYPTDQEVSDYLINTPLYKNNNEKTKILLELLEQSFEHKEKVIFDQLTIEHIMPQKLSDSWKQYLKYQSTLLELDETEEESIDLLHSIGNLTLTAYNADMSNQLFEYKKNFFYANSHLELNKHLAREYQSWHSENIKHRAQFLLNKFLKLYAKPMSPPPIDTGFPSELQMNAKRIFLDKTNWKQLLIEIFRVIRTELTIDQWEAFKIEFQAFIKNKDQLIKDYGPVQLGENEFAQVNASKKTIVLAIKKICTYLSRECQIEAELKGLNDHMV